MMFKPRPKGMGKDNFLKLANGEEVSGVFRGEIYTFRNHWRGKGTPSLECSGADCAVCATKPEKGPSFRFRINFITSKDGKWIAKIFESGGDVYDDLARLDKKFDLSTTVVDLSRTGVDKETRYNVLPRKDIPLTKEMEAQINAVPLLALSAAEQKEPA
jgi:hypothetical protein